MAKGKLRLLKLFHHDQVQRGCVKNKEGKLPMKTRKIQPMPMDEVQPSEQHLARRFPGMSGSGPLNLHSILNQNRPRLLKLLIGQRCRQTNDVGCRNFYTKQILFKQIFTYILRFTGILLQFSFRLYIPLLLEFNNFSFNQSCLATISFYVKYYWIRLKKYV